MTMILIITFHVFERCSSCVSFSPNGSYLLIGTLDDTIGLFALKTGPRAQCVKKFIGHHNRRFSLSSCFYPSKSNSFVVSASEDNNVSNIVLSGAVSLFSPSPKPRFTCGSFVLEKQHHRGAYKDTKVLLSQCASSTNCTSAES